MTILSDIFSGIVSVGKSVIGAVNGNSVGSSLLRTVLSGFALKQVNNSIKKQNSTASTVERSSLSTTTVDPGVRLQVPPAQDQRVPIVYGTSHIGGIITDAVQSNSNQTMTYVLTLCEMTGNLLSTGSASEFTFLDVYYNDQKITFQSDGITVDYTTDRSGNQDYSTQNLVKVWCYAGNSESPVIPVGYTNASPSDAYDIVPNWTSNHIMHNLVFAVVQVTYSKDKGVTGLPTMRFHLRNSMTLPGDCLLDYMTNTVYGAGIPAEEIYSS